MCSWATLFDSTIIVISHTKDCQHMCRFMTCTRLWDVIYDPYIWRISSPVRNKHVFKICFGPNKRKTQSYAWAYNVCKKNFFKLVGKLYTSGACAVLRHTLAFTRMRQISSAQGNAHIVWLVHAQGFATCAKILLRGGLLQGIFTKKNKNGILKHTLDSSQHMLQRKPLGSERLLLVQKKVPNHVSILYFLIASHLR
jgi:hypothetical protein